MTFADDHEQASIPTADSDARQGLHRAEQSVRDALTGLDGLDELPTAEHVRRFDAVHTALTDALSNAENHLTSSDDNGS